MQKVTKFQTSDGKLFDSEALAKLHEIQEDFKNAILQEFEVAFKSQRVNAILESFPSHAKAIRDIINKYLSRLPNPNKAGRWTKKEIV